MSLHWRKQLFVAEYVAHPELNATEVAKRCGYTGEHVKTRAYELLRDPEVKAAIEHAQQQILAGVALTAEDVIRDILAARQRCVEAGDGAWQTQGRLKCDELLGRYLNMWQEKIEINFAEELAERLKKARQNAEREKTVESVPKLRPPAELFVQEKVPNPIGKMVELPREDRQDWVEKLV